MNKLTNTKNINNFSSESFEWKQVQNEMKNKLGLEVYESWLKKISFVEEFNNYLNKKITLEQAKVKKKETLIFGVTRDGFSKSISSFNQAILAMRYILVDDEYKKMRRSKPEKQEELFLKYWKDRDPSPDTKKNELQDEYFARVAYANNAFKGSTDGWRTQMGEIYIKFGRPDDIEEYSDPYTRYYQQRWHYYRINKYFDFVDESGFGDYRLTSPFYGGNAW